MTEIVEYEAVTTVPNTPTWIRGVTNLRGRVVPVVDLAVKFGLPASSISKFSCIIITEVIFEGENLTMGVLADSVSLVIELSADEIEQTPPFGTRVKTEFLLGLGTLGKKFCLILDIDKVLSADEMLAVIHRKRFCPQLSTARKLVRRPGDFRGILDAGTAARCRRPAARRSR